jgi:hypothetical protein
LVAITTEAKERDGGLDESEDDNGDGEELGNGVAENAGLGDGEAGVDDEEPGGGAFAGDEGFDCDADPRSRPDDDRTLGLRRAHKD